jgi:hypothetical protein
MRQTLALLSHDLFIVACIPLLFPFSFWFNGINDGEPNYLKIGYIVLCRDITLDILIALLYSLFIIVTYYSLGHMVSFVICEISIVHQNRSRK